MKSLQSFQEKIYNHKRLKILPQILIYNSPRIKSWWIQALDSHRKTSSHYCSRISPYTEEPQVIPWANQMVAELHSILYPDQPTTSTEKDYDAESISVERKAQERLHKESYNQWSYKKERSSIQNTTRPVQQTYVSCPFPP